MNPVHSISLSFLCNYVPTSLIPPPSVLRLFVLASNKSFLYTSLWLGLRFPLSFPDRFIVD